MAGTKRSAPSRSFSPEDSPSKKTRIDRHVDMKQRGAQDKNFERKQEELKASTEYHEQATNDKKMAVKKDSSVKDEAKKDEETRFQPTAVIDHFQNDVTTCDGRDTSPTVLLKGNDENLPSSRMKLQEPVEKDEKQR